jgi:AcrR family transcriptional regulator
MKPAGDARTKLIRTALDSMHRTSFENVGVAQITAKAGVPKGSFYHWVPSREALGVEVIDAFAEAGAELRAELLLADGRAPLQRLRDYFNHVIGLLEKRLCKRSPVVLPIPWTSQVSHLDENVAAAALELTSEEVYSRRRGEMSQDGFSAQGMAISLYGPR